jgi:hypothetical protein
MEQHASRSVMPDEQACLRGFLTRPEDSGANVRAGSVGDYRMTGEVKSNCRCSKAGPADRLGRRKAHGSWEWSPEAARCARTSLRPVAPWSCRLWGRRSLSWPKSCRERDEALPHRPVASKGSKGLEDSGARQDCLDDGLILRPSRGEAGLVRPDRPMEPVQPRLAMLKPCRRLTLAASDVGRAEEAVPSRCLVIQSWGDGTLYVSASVS